MANHFCFACGREIKLAVGSPVSLICGVCEARHGGRTAPTYTLRPVGGNAIGPLSREQVTDELKRGAVGPEDHISESGDDFTRLDHHPHFLAYFIPESPQAEELAEAVAEYSRRQSGMQREKAMAPVRTIVRWATAIGVPILVFGVVKFAVPDSVKDAAISGISTVWDQAALQLRKATDEEAAMADLRANMEVPGDELVAALQAKWPAVEEGSVALTQRGWENLLAGTRAGVSAAGSDFEQAVARSPDDVPALSGLAVAYTILGRGEGELSLNALVALDRARVLGTDPVALERAQAGMSVASGAKVQAMESAQECLKMAEGDGLCLYYLGASQLALGAYDKAAETLLEARGALGPRPGVELALARARLRLGDYAQAVPALEAHAAANPNDSDTLAMMAEIWRELGQGSKALDYATRASSLDSGQLRARALQGTLQLYIQGNARGAFTTLKLLIDTEGFRRLEDWRQIAVYASHAARLAGDNAAALELAKLALDGAPASGPARMAQSMALQASGDAAAAEEALQLADTSDLSALESARFHFNAGEFFRGQDRQAAASGAYGDAVTEAPQWAVGSLGLAMSHISAENAIQAADALGRLYDKDIRRSVRQDPVHSIWVQPIDIGEISRAAQPLFRNDARLSIQLPQVMGILHAVGCLSYGDGGRCGLALGQLAAAVEADDADVISHAFAGRIKLLQGNYAGALAHFDRVLARDDKKALLLAMQGRCLYAVGRKADGDKAFRKAYNVSENDPGVYYHHGEALLAAGDRAGAQERFELTLKLDPSDVTTRGRLLALGG